jgi:hypothetical protein
MSQYLFFRENLFDPRDPEEFKDKLCRQLCRGQEEHDLERIAGFVRENYSWEQGRRKLLECITLRG